ncbi:MAG: tRNA (adenosine(37)-N6)-threonylcarbamoyltransferase complex dimerization subunit type 1 TsaB [Candidatus Melainabacteria bacterium GWA2_34_9]|nr:MAG: tRNA (adenosine(37)-N6)-threonylcarbamoyltransferase complex dimerization subunit type 1 TsaB [Candidatus Melainabacteria bacterium GWA2_34_9]
MKILTFDTSTETMYVTIDNDSDVEAYKIIETTEKSYNSAHLIPVIIELLQGQNLTLQNIKAIGVNIGPGSFTGIRASATVAKVMAQQLDIPVVGVSSLEIYSLLNNTEKDSLVLLDARRGKAYIAVYGQDGNIILEPQAIEYENAVEYAKNNDLFIISDKKMSEGLNEAGLKCLNLSEVKENFGLFLAKSTYKHLSSQKQADSFKWPNLNPLYIQPPPISTAKSKSKL